MFSILLFLAFVRDLNGLYCVESSHSFRISRKDFDWTILTSQVVETNHVESWDDDRACRVTINVDYNIHGEDYVSVNYGEIIHDACDYMEFGTSFTLENSRQSIVSYIDYVCSSHHYCEQTFVNQWMKQLLGAENNPLHTAINYLMTNSSESAKCNWKTPTSECASHMCFALYDELKEVPLKNVSCSDGRSSGSTYIYVKTKFVESPQVSPIELDYKCKKNRFTHEISYEHMDHRRVSENAPHLSCTQQTFTSKPVNLRSSNFSSSLHQLGENIKSLLNNVNRCDVYMEADYRQHEGHITITYDEPRTRTDKYTSFDMILALESATPSIWSRMYYTCVPPHPCDRQLVNKWIQWLIDISSQAAYLESMVSSEKTIESYECKIWSHTVDHSVDICFAYKYKKTDGTHVDSQNNMNSPPVTEHNGDRNSASTSAHNPCSRLEERKTQVYKYVLSEIPYQCVPRSFFKQPDSASTSTSSHLSTDQSDHFPQVKLINLNPDVKLNEKNPSGDEINESTTTTTVEPPLINYLREIP